MKKTIIICTALSALCCVVPAAEAAEKNMTSGSYYARASLRFSRGEYRDFVITGLITGCRQRGEYEIFH